jgi:hypothetical protein
MDTSGRSTRLVPMVLPLLYGATNARRGRSADQTCRRRAPSLAQVQKAKLVVGKLDRLARDTRFLLAVLDSGVEVLFCDLPQIPGDGTRVSCYSRPTRYRMSGRVRSDRRPGSAQSRGHQQGTSRLGITHRRPFVGGAERRKVKTPRLYGMETDAARNPPRGPRSHTRRPVARGNKRADRPRKHLQRLAGLQS